LGGRRLEGQAPRAAVERIENGIADADWEGNGLSAAVDRAAVTALSGCGDASGA
jgi:hypothetical protein